MEITGENADFDAPNNSSWVRIAIQLADAFQTCINTERYQSDGVVTVQVFTPMNTGSKTGSEIADSAMAVFKTAKLDKLEYLDFTTAFIGQDQGWWQININCSYRAYD